MFVIRKEKRRICSILRENAGTHFSLSLSLSFPKGIIDNKILKELKD